jgi:hypothetical protein
VLFFHATPLVLVTVTVGQYELAGQLVAVVVSASVAVAVVVVESFGAEPSVRVGLVEA